jgi:hypothetical protein
MSLKRSTVDMELHWPALAVTLLLASGCATGPSLEQLRASIPEAAPNRARVFLYRNSSPFGADVQPSVKFDNAVVSRAVPGGVFFCDVAPGHHVVSITTEVEKLATLDIAAGQVSYVKMEAGFGWLMGRIHLEVVSPEIGAGEAARASLIKSECPLG